MSKIKFLGIMIPVVFLLGVILGVVVERGGLDVSPAPREALAGVIGNYESVQIVNGRTADAVAVTISISFPSEIVNRTITMGVKQVIAEHSLEQLCVKSKEDIRHLIMLHTHPTAGPVGAITVDSTQYKNPPLLQSRTCEVI